MTLAAKILYLSALLIGLLAGAFGGFEYNNSMIKLYWDGVPWMAQDEFDDFSVLQYKHADLEHAQAALLTTASFVEELDKANPSRDQEKDIAFTYTRLSLLEDAANNASQSEVYMAKARSWWKTSSGRDVTDSEMKASVKIMDQTFHR